MPLRHAFHFSFFVTVTLIASPSISQVFHPASTQRFDQGDFLLFGEGPGTNDAFGSALAAGDFDCDGFDDLAIGTPFEDVSVQLPPNPPEVRIDAGSVIVIYGRHSGLFGFDNQDLIESDLAGGVSEAFDRFGEVLFVGDFNGDQCDDLAIGTPFEHVGTIGDAGAVYVVYGSNGGLDTSSSQVWTQQGGAVAGVVEAGDKFGSALGAGDLDGDGFDELIIGAAAEELDDGPFEGAVWMIEGSSNGLLGDTTSWVQLLTQDDPLIGDLGEPGDSFGAAVATCDFNDDGFDDVVVGSPGESATFPNSGATHVFFGSNAGVTREHDEDVVFYGNRSGIHRGKVLAAAQLDPVFGCAIASGLPDLDVIVPAGSILDAGALQLTRRLSTGTWGFIGYEQGRLTAHYSLSGVDPSEQNDRFASTLAFGDFNGDQFGELVIGTPMEDLSTTQFDHGLVQLLPGGAATPDADAASAVREIDLPGTGQLEAGNSFGWSLAVGDFDGNGFDDLAVGVPFDDIDMIGGPVINAGTVVVLYSAAIFTDGFESGDVSAWTVP